MQETVKFILILAYTILLLYSLPVFGQQSYQRTFGTPYYEELQSIQNTADSGIILAGYTGFGNACLIKLDAKGSVQWSNKISGTGVSLLYGVQQTFDSGYIATGRTDFADRKLDVLLMKTDVAGNLLWIKTIGDAIDRETGTEIKQTADSGYIIAGNSYSLSAGLNDFYIIKTDKNGNIEWTKTVGGTSNDNAYTVIQTNEGGYVVAGLTRSVGAGGIDVLMVKLDKTGNILWMKSYGGTGDDRARGLIQTTDGGYALTGVTSSFGAGNYDMYLLRTDSSGKIIVSKSYGGMGEEWGIKIKQTTDGGFMLSGFTESFGGGRADYYLVRIDSFGDTLWTGAYGGAYNEYCTGGVDALGGSFVIGGYSESFAVGSYDFYLIKTDSIGKSVCNQFATLTRVASPPTQTFAVNLTISSIGTAIMVNKSLENGLQEKKICVLKAKVDLGNDTTLCFGDTFLLNGNVLPGSEILWSTADTGKSINITQHGTYWCRAIFASDTAFDTVRIAYKPPFKVYLGTDTAFCGKFSHLLNAANKNFNYMWNTNDTTITLRVAKPGIYSVAIRDSNACAFGDTILIGQLNKPSIQISYDSVCRFAVLTFNDTIEDFLWSTGDTINPVNIYQPGVYSLTFHNKFCSLSDSVTILKIAPPDLDLGQDTNLCAGSPVELKAGASGDNFTWSTGETSSSIFVSKPGYYWVKSSSNGCSSLDTIYVGNPCETFYYIPNAFTPGSNNLNDLFTVYGDNISDIRLKIFSRWGELIYEGVAWDGNYNNQLCPDGVYLYLVSFKGFINNREMKVTLSGAVTLLR